MEIALGRRGMKSYGRRKLVAGRETVLMVRHQLASRTDITK